MPEFRREACACLIIDEPVKAVADELSMSMHTLYRWCRQALIDMGRLEGVKEFAQNAPFVDIILKCRRACNAGHFGMGSLETMLRHLVRRQNARSSRPGLFRGCPV